jgi:HEAT repeat protein
MFVVALVSWAAATAGKDDNPQKLRKLLQSGDYRQAYESVAAHGTPDRRTALAELARTLLIVAVSGDDTYLRWYALQASLPLEDRALAAAVRPRSKAVDRYEQSLALEIIGHTDPAGSREELLAGLDSPYRAVRLRALEGLAKLKDPTLAERMAGVLTGDPDPDLRCLAARAIAETAAPAATTMLHKALDDPLPVVQEEAVRGLVALHDPELSPLLRRRLADNPQEQRVATIRLAGLVPDPELLDDLGPYLGDGDAKVRAFAAAAILAILEHTSPGTQ